MLNLKVNPAILFTPGDKQERFQKAEEIGANGIILDLEDSVALSDKNKAREIVIHYLSQPHSNRVLKFIRINHITTQAGLADLQILSTQKLFVDGFVYPKTETSEELNIINHIFASQNVTYPILGLIETARGLKNIANIVERSVNIVALLFGAADFSLDVGCDIEFEALYLARMKIVQAAAIKKIACYDSPYFNFKDNNGLLNETKKIKTLGFSGKLAIHPKQIDIIKSVFKPIEAEFKEAQEIVKVYETAKGQACQYHGKMVDLPLYRKAKEIIEIYNNLS